MNITMQCSQHEEGVSRGTWDVAIIGPVLDDRGKAARNFASRHSRRLSNASISRNRFPCFWTIKYLPLISRRTATLTW